MWCNWELYCVHLAKLSLIWSRSCGIQRMWQFLISWLNIKHFLLCVWFWWQNMRICISLSECCVQRQLVMVTEPSMEILVAGLEFLMVRGSSWWLHHGDWSDVLGNSSCEHAWSLLWFLYGCGPMSESEIYCAFMVVTKLARSWECLDNHSN